MMIGKSLQKIRQYPILILLAISMLIGLFTFRDYGLSWDEPLFYDYAKAIGYAYSPSEWFSGNFNLENAYGPSASDHGNRGPAYILLAREPESLLEWLGLDSASAWHLINFLTLQLGIYLFYRLSKRWMNEPAALISTALFAWQPLLWGHTFINPKDPPFLVFFVGAMCFGFEMVDELAQTGKYKTQKLLLAAFFLGIATSIRVLGPLAGLLVCIYGLSKATNATALIWIKNLALYTAITILIAFITWPYLWPDPIHRFLEAFGFMSDNPTQLRVLFNGALYRADDLPRRYLPVLLGLTLTEPVWILFFIGIIIAAIQVRREKLLTLALVLLWFIVPLVYVLLRRPPMYDGYRHFLFILPPIFVIAGLGLEKLFTWIKPRWANVSLVLVIFLPSIIGIIQLHPYEYTYYNSFVGGTGGAFRKFETDYWLTCYKEAVETYQTQKPVSATMYVNREAYIAATYADKDITVLERRGAINEIKSGDLILIDTRANEDLKIYRDMPTVLEVGRAGATFCVIKRIQ